MSKRRIRHENTGRAPKVPHTDLARVGDGYVFRSGDRWWAWLNDGRSDMAYGPFRARAARGGSRDVHDRTRENAVMRSRTGQRERARG